MRRRRDRARPGRRRSARDVCEEVARRRCRGDGAAVRTGVLRRRSLRRPRRAPARPRSTSRARAAVPPRARAARAQHAQRRQLGDPSRPPRRPLAVHRPRDPRPHARPSLHAHDAARGAAIAPAISWSSSTSRSRSRSSAHPRVERVAHAVGRLRPRSSRTSSSSPPSRRDLGRHPRQERRRRPRALPRGDRATADRRGGRGRRRRLGLARRERRAAHKASAHASTPYRASEFHHGRTRNLGAELARGETLVFTSQDAYAAGDAWLARLTAPLRDDDTIAGVYGRQLPHEDARPPEQYFLDFLYGPDRRVQRLDPGHELSFEATLFSNVNSALPRRVWEAFPFADDIVMSEDQEWSRRILRAGLGSRTSPRLPSTTRTRTPSPVRCGGSSTRARPRSGRTSTARSPRRRCGRRASTTRRARLRGSGEQASGAGSRTRPCTRSQSSPASSSGDAIGFSPWRSSLGSARIRSTGERSAHRDSPGVGRASSRQPSSRPCSWPSSSSSCRRSGSHCSRDTRFRQTQTAYTARIYHEQGIDLLHPKLPVLGEPFEVPVRVSPLPGRSIGRHGRRRPRRRRDAAHRASLLPPDGAAPLRPRPTRRRPCQRRRRSRRVRRHSLRASSGAARR